MDQSPNHIQSLFTGRGGQFILSPQQIMDKATRIRAILFDWDGVFNEGWKGGGLNSGFSEIDSMGTNLLRFSYWLNREKVMPVTGIITGAENPAAFDFARREHFNAVYFKVYDKIKALQHLKENYGIESDEVMYVFDDVLDLPLAKECGLRFMVRSDAKVMFCEYCDKRFVDYHTAFSGGGHAVREICELVIGLEGNYKEVVDRRLAFDRLYAEYFELRNRMATTYFTPGPKGDIQEYYSE